MFSEIISSWKRISSIKIWWNENNLTNRMRTNNILILLIFEFVGHLAARICCRPWIFLDLFMLFELFGIDWQRSGPRRKRKRDEKEEGTRITIYTSNSREVIRLSGYSTRLLFIYADAATRIMRLPIIIFHYTRSIERCE